MEEAEKLSHFTKISRTILSAARIGKIFAEKWMQNATYVVP